MRKKTAVVWGYFAKNLGDDLMLKAFLNTTKGKYKKIYINSYKEYRKYYSQLGVTVVAVNSVLYRAANKILNIFHRAELYYHCSMIKNADFIMLGGSLFAEADDYRISQCQIVNLTLAANKSDQVYVIGSNFGPYRTKEFLRNYELIFEKCRDICFRDKQSCGMFHNNLNVRYAPDVILSGIWEDFRVPEGQNLIVISAIDLTKRKDLNFAINDYEQMMADIAEYHLRKGENVVLAAFCKYEGDVDACKRIKELCGEENLKIAVYDGLEFLTLFSNAKKVYGTRFHSVILSMYYNIPCVPFIYSQKTYDALISYGVSFDCVNLENLSEYSVEEITENYEIRDMDFNVKELAKKQFEGVNLQF